MANSENSKVKLLALYDFFLRNVNSYAEEESAVSMNDIINHLKAITGTEFDRKSIYSDIKRINDMMRDLGYVKNGEDWIFLCSGRKYSRRELNYELTLDEARLIVDAIRTTPFTKTNLCQKIEEMYPSYFKTGYKSLVKHDKTISNRTVFLLHNIRKCIEDKTVFIFKYGYKYAGDLKCKSLKVTSPLALDWEDGNYYLIAVDNMECVKGTARENSIRRYRIDRIDPSSTKIDYKEKYCGYADDKDKILDKYLKASVNAFADTNSRIITMTIRCEDEKTLLRAYNAFDDGIRVKTIIDDKLEKGYVKFAFEAGVVPTLFTLLFKLYTFEGVTLDIEDDEVNERFKEYLNRALGKTEFKVV